MLVYHVALRQKDHPRRNSGTNGCHNERHVGRVGRNRGHHRGIGNLAPVGACHKRSHHVGDKDAAHQQQNLLDTLKTARHGKQPNKERHQRHRNAGRNTKERKAARNTRELRDGYGRVGNQQGRHGKHAFTHTKALTNERSQALTRYAATARRSLLRHN